MTPEALIIESMFMVVTKDGDDIPFMLNEAQRELDDNLTGRDLVPKARQKGVSTYVLARFLAACLSRRNTRAVVISHETGATQRMLKKVHYMLQTIRGPKAVTENLSAHEITFPKTNSMFYIGTAGSRAFGRGDTITHLHCSEYAYWPNPKGLFSGLADAVPLSGEIIIESTGNGLNDYYNRSMRAAKGASSYKVHFLPWHTTPEYTLELTEEEELELMSNLDEVLEEDKLVDKLTPGQIAWRRMKIEEKDYDLGVFKQEYPMTLDECFQSSNESIFYKVNYIESDEWKKIDYNFHGFETHPIRDYIYAIGADVAAGVDRDSSAIEIICLNTMEQVGEFISNRTSPDYFAIDIEGIATKYNNAFVVVESNNHGLVTIDNLMNIYDSSLIYQEMASRGNNEISELMSLGFRTTTRTKPLMIGRLRKLLATSPPEGILIHSPILRAELTTYIEHENGLLGAQEGCHDDTVMAMANLVMGIEEAALYGSNEVSIIAANSVYQPFTLEGILDSVGGKRNVFPISAQHINAR